MDPRVASFGGFQSTLGAILIAVVVNTYLFGIVSYQYASYFSAQFKDPRWIKWTLCGLFISDTTHSVSIVYLIWLYLIDGFGSPTSALAIHWPLPLSVFIAGMTSLVVQSFLAYRILLLSQRKFAVAALVFLSVTSFSFAISVVVRLCIIENQLSRAPIDDILITCWLSFRFLVDLLISGTLLYVMRTSGTTQSDRVVKRLARMSIQTGLFSAIFALLCAVLWLSMPRANWYLIFGLPVSRVYTCTLLDTLISRPKLRAMMNGATSNGLVTDGTRRPISIARPIQTGVSSICFTSVGASSAEPASATKSKPTV